MVDSDGTVSKLHRNHQPSHQSIAPSISSSPHLRIYLIPTMLKDNTPNVIPKSLEEHNQFIAALEKYGGKMSGNEWTEMSQELNWPIQDVQLYAYCYMNQLQNMTMGIMYRPDDQVGMDVDDPPVSRTPTSTTLTSQEAPQSPPPFPPNEQERNPLNNDNDNNNNNNQDNNSSSNMASCVTPDAENTTSSFIPNDTLSIYNEEHQQQHNQEILRWTFEECILFDNLLAVYGPTCTSTPSNDWNVTNNDDDEDGVITRWESIASMLPNKTPQQCQERYSAMMNKNKNEKNVSFSLDCNTDKFS